MDSARRGRETLLSDIEGTPSDSSAYDRKQRTISGRSSGFTLQQSPSPSYSLITTVSGRVYGRGTRLASVSRTRPISNDGARGVYPSVTAQLSRSYFVHLRQDGTHTHTRTHKPTRLPGFCFRCQKGEKQRLPRPPRHFIPNEI